MADHDVAAALRALADQLEGPPPGAVPLEHLPSARWESVGERALSRSLRTLRSEALHALAAFHVAHAVGAEVLRGRVVSTYVKLQQGRDADHDPEVVQVDAMGWARDELALHQALRTVAEVDAPDLTVSAALGLRGDEHELAENIVDHLEGALTRGLLLEQEEGS